MARRVVRIGKMPTPLVSVLPPEPPPHEPGEGLPCAGAGPHTTTTYIVHHGVRLCWADWARGYDLLNGKGDPILWRTRTSSD